MLKNYRKLKKKGFHVTKWMSSSKKVIAEVPLPERSPCVRNIDLAKEELPTAHARCHGIWKMAV